MGKVRGWIRRRLTRVAAVHAARHRASLGDRFPPTVSFTFDDFPASAGLAAAMLEQSEGRGTFYLAAGLIGQDSKVGRIATVDEVADLARRGHEIGCHGLSHVAAEIVGSDRFGRDLDANRRRVGELLPDLELRSFAFPFGSYTWRAKRVALRRYHSCRSTRPGLEQGRADLGLLAGNALYSDSEPLERVRELVAHCADAGGWLIFYTHDVAERPSPYGCTPGYFESVLTAALTAGCRVRTVGATVDDLMAGATGPPAP